MFVLLPLAASCSVVARQLRVDGNSGSGSYQRNPFQTQEIQVAFRKISHCATMAAPHCWPSQGSYLVQGAHESLISESHSDLTLVTKEGINIPVHKIILAQCPYLQPILLSASCCGGRCSSQVPATVFLPDLPYRALKVALDFLYHGRIECSIEERIEVKEVLKLLGVPSATVEVEERKEGWVSCTSCSKYLSLDELAEHMVDVHVLRPAEADVEKVRRGDNCTVRCSYSSTPCYLDADLVRINNGFFNYVGKGKPLECVVQHYKEVHLEDMVAHLRQEYDLAIDRDQVERFETNLTRLLEKEVHSPPKVSLEEGRRGLADDHNPAPGLETNDEAEDEEVESDYSGNLDSPDEKEVEDDDIEDEEDPGSTDTIPCDTNDKPPTVLPDLVSLTISPTTNLERKDATLEPPSKKPRREVATTKCRICNKEISSEQFKRHVTSHVKSRWTEVRLGEGRRACNHCSKSCQGRENLIFHLATKHNELANKLKQEGESLSDYEVREVGDVEQERILSLTTATKEEVRVDNMD